MNEQSKDEMNRYYTGLLEKHGANPEALGKGWHDSYQQREKFILIESFGELENNSSILDVGCGLGYLCDLYRALGWKGIYTGVDINPEMVDAAQKRLPDDRFLCLDIEEQNLDEKHDYVFCISTLHHKPKYEDGMTYGYRMIKTLFEIANKGLVFDMFSDKVDYLEEDNLYCNPIDILEFCYELTKRLLLRNDYRPYQFMMYMYKDNQVNERNRFIGFNDKGRYSDLAVEKIWTT